MNVLWPHDADDVTLIHCTNGILLVQSLPQKAALHEQVAFDRHGNFGLNDS